MAIDVEWVLIIVSNYAIRFMFGMFSVCYIYYIMNVPSENENEILRYYCNSERYRSTIRACIDGLCSINYQMK